MRKTFFTAVFVLLVCTTVFSQGNSGLGFNYQAVVRGVDGFVLPLPKDSVKLRFSLMPGQQATQASWVETHNVMPDVYGTVGVTVGKGKKDGGVAAEFKDVNFAAVYYWLKVEINENGNYRELSYTQLTSVPYAEVATIGIGIPAGTILAFGGDFDKIPAGWLLCDGREISRSEYANLYNAIETAWGHGNNSTTFNIPDCRGLFLRGVAGNTLNDPDVAARLPQKEGGNSSNKVGSIQGDAIRNITGAWGGGYSGTPFANGAFGQSGGTSVANWDSGSRPAFDFDASRVVPTGHDNRPKNVYVNYIIKY